MREHKYKAWNVEKKIMHDIAFPSWNGMIEVWKDNKPHTIIEYLSIGGPEHQGILLQFIGFKDKNEKEIYEKYIVKIRNPKQNFYTIKLVEWDDNSYNLFSIHSEFTEIIGNGIENPELLK